MSVESIKIQIKGKTFDKSFDRSKIKLGKYFYLKEIYGGNDIEFSENEFKDSKKFAVSWIAPSLILKRKMNTKSKANAYFYLGLIFAIWFLLTSSVWTYLANVVISFPFGIVSLILWHKGKKIEGNPKRYKIIAILLILGLVASLLSLIYFLVFE